MVEVTIRLSDKLASKILSWQEDEFGEDEEEISKLESGVANLLFAMLSDMHLFPEKHLPDMGNPSYINNILGVD